MPPKKRFHLNGWYHYTYISILVITTWYKTSYYSILHWLFACLFLWHMGYKFLEESKITIVKWISKIHLGISGLILLKFIVMLIMSIYDDEKQKRFLENYLNYNVQGGVIGFTSAFALLLLLVVLYSFLVTSLVMMVLKSEMPLEEYEMVDDNDEFDDSPYTFHQKKVSYLRQNGIQEKIIFFIVLFLCLNDGLIAFLLMICMLVWLGTHFHFIDKTTRFEYGKLLTQIIAYISVFSLFFFIYSGLQGASPIWNLLTGTLNHYGMFKFIGIVLISGLVLCSVRASQYQQIVPTKKVVEIEKVIQLEQQKQSASQFEIMLGQNYFGVIMVLSVFWICKQLSILRGMVYLLLLLGQLKRYRFKARKKWQCSIAIIYVACIQFLILQLFNIPFLNGGVYLQYLGVYEQPKFDPQESFAIWHFFFRRLNVILMDLFYILIVSWLVYSQQTIEDKRHQKIINDLVTSKGPERNEQQGCWSRFVQLLKTWWDEASKSFLIHFDELVIIYCLITALRHADICRGVFLVYFIFYVFMELAKRRFYMRQHLSVAYVILFTLYTLQLLFLNNINLLNILFSYIGVGEISDKYKYPFYFIYQYYDIILGCLLLTFQIQIIQKTETYKKYKFDIQQDDYEFSMDFFRKQLVTHGLIYCQIIALIVAFIPPANLLSLIFIFFFQVFLYLYYLHGNQKTVMHTLIKYWPLMITLTLIILLVRYTYTIKFVNLLIQNFFAQPTLLSDLGLNPYFNTLKLLGNGIALILLCSYRRTYYTVYYHKYMDQQIQEKHEYGTFSHFLYSFKIRISVYGIYHIPKIIFIFAFFIAVYQMSYIGFIFACMIFLIVLREKNNNWQEISIPFLVVLFLQIIIQYIFQAEMLRSSQGQETIAWIGIEDEYQSKYWNLIIMFHLCELLPVLSSLCKMCVSEQYATFLFGYDREIRSLRLMHKLVDILKPSFNLVVDRMQIINNESESSGQLNDQESLNSFDQDPEDDQDVRFKKLFEYWSQQSPQKQYNYFLTLFPFYVSLKHHQYFDKLFTQIGLELTLFFIVITAYYQRNFFSVFYIIVASIFANYSGVLDQRNQGKGLSKFRFAWTILCFLQMLEVIRKYATIQWTPPSWDVRKPWWYYQYSCDGRGKEAFNEEDPNDTTSDFMKCQNDWNYWLSLEGFINWDVWVNFLSFLVCICFQRHFMTIDRLQQREQMMDSEKTLSENKISIISQSENADPNDFTYSKNRIRIMDFVKFFIFCYFYKFALIVFLLIGMSSDIQSYTEVISCVYFFAAINLLYMSNKLEKERNQIWEKLILFNTAVMIMMSLYQAPFVKCPIIYENDRYYYDNQECVMIQIRNHYYNSDFFIFLQDQFQLLAQQSETLKKYEGISTLDVIYMFVSHLLGLNKTLDFKFGFSKETLMAVFFLLGLLQRNIWAHPYIRLYVEPYLQRQQERQKIAAIQMIEGIHLKRIWDFKYVQAQKQVHESLQQRVQERVKKWDDFFAFDREHKSFFYFADQEIAKPYRMLLFQEENEEKLMHTSFDSDDFNQFKGNVKQLIKAEKITQNNQAPVIHLYDACCIVQNSINDIDLALRLKKLMLQEEKWQLEKVYLNDKIGLTQFYNEIIWELDEQIHRVEMELLELGKQYESSVEEHKSDHILSQQDMNMHFVEFEQNNSFQSLNLQDIGEKQKNSQSDDKQQDSKATTIKQSITEGVSQQIKKLIIYILTHDTYIRESVYQKQEIDKKKLSVLVFVFVAHYFQVVCVLLMVLNACFNANLLALFYPFSAFMYGLLENPLPSRKYWNFLLIYTIIVISLKFIYQMPVFCDSPPYRFIGFSTEEACEPRLTTQQEKITRIDYMIGIRKYQGNETFMNRIFIELLLFIALLIQRYLLQTQGLWDYLRLSCDQYFIPQFKCKAIKIPKQEISKHVSEDKIEDDFSEIENADKSPDVVVSPSLFGQIQEINQNTQYQLINFYYRLFPHSLTPIYTHNLYDPIKNKVIKKEDIMLPEQIKVGRDIYAPQFIICLIILVYFLLFYPNIIAKRSYAHITQGQSQRFSSEVIFVLLIVIIIIVMDRMLFIIRKITKDPREEIEESQNEDFSKNTLTIKVIMHFLLILTVHYYFFFVIPKKTNKRFQESYYLIFAYILVCIYFIVSSVQIRYGYPISQITQIFTNSHKPLNSLAFKIYRAIPFLYELRVIIDWTFTTTALDLIQWFRLEDIFANLYICQAYMDSRMTNHKLGQPRASTEKCLNGCLFAVFIIFIIILPILIFSTLNPAVEINNITNGRFSIKAAFLGAEDKLFFTLFQVNDLELLDIPNDQFKKIQLVYGEIESSWQERMQKIRVKRFSDLEWNLPENYRDQIRNMIKSQDYEVQISCEWIFQKSDQQGGAKSFSGSNIVLAPETFVNNFGKILAPRAPDAVFDIGSLIPKFLYAGESAETQVLRLEPVNIREDSGFFQDIRLIHKKTSDVVFFEIVPNDDSADMKQIGASGNNRIEFFVLNELAFGSLIGALSTNMSIIGIYATFVLAVGRFLRFTYDKISTRVMFEEMPETHELFDLCQSIYIARVDGNFNKEEIFYELLIRIYRSPEILFKMTGSSIYDKLRK